MADTTQTLAQLLRTARTQRGLSRAQLAVASRVPLTFIIAIEEENLDALPPAVFCRGFLRIIARHLQCEPAPLLTALATRPRPQADTSQLVSPHTVFSRRGRRKTTARRPRKATLLLALLLVLCGGVVFYLLYPRPAILPSPPSVGSASTRATAPVPDTPAVTAAARQRLRLQVMRPLQIEIAIDAGKSERRVLLPQSYEFAFEQRAHLTIADITAVKLWFNGEPLGNLVRGGRRRVLIFTRATPTTARAGEHAGHHFQR